MYEKKYHTANLNSLSFLITGGAGFIGSNLVEYLLNHGAGRVRVLDNLSTSSFDNVRDFETNPAFEFIKGDIRDLETCKNAVKGIDYVSHQAALGSVPRSINDPITTNEVNIGGFLNMISSVKDESSVRRFIYAASSSTYGDSAQLPKIEDIIGRPLSPYAVTKYVNELYADVFAKTYGTPSIGLRYFNIYGPKQSPDGAYAAVIPLFIRAIKNNQSSFINGDGLQTRDFTFVENAVQANIRAFFTEHPNAINQVYNIACGEQTSLKDLWYKITKIEKVNIDPQYRSERAGDIKHSKASITKATELLGYSEAIKLAKGIKLTVDAFKE